MASPPAERIGVPSVSRRDLRFHLMQALKDSGSVGLGAFPMGVAFGVLVVHSGFPWWWASVFSGFIRYLRGDPRLQTGEESDSCGAGRGSEIRRHGEFPKPRAQPAGSYYRL